MSNPGERLDVLDGLRGIAISLVVWYHAWLVSGLTIAVVNVIAEAGFLGVDLFFFISGFCLFYPYARSVLEGRPLPTTRRFFTRRAAKILPSYLLALVVFAAIYRDRFQSPQDAAFQLLSHLTFLHTLNPATFGAISGPLWTIGVEVQFYLIFPLICKPFRSSPLLVYAGLTGIAEGYRWGLGQAGLGSTFWIFNQLPAYLDVFGAGMLAAYWFVTIRQSSTLPNRKTLTLVSMTLAATLLAFLVTVTTIDRTSGIDATYAWVNAHRILLGPLFIALAVSTAFAARPWRAVVSARPLVFLSVISYNLYLWNLEIVVWYHNAGLSPAAAFGLSIVSSLAVASAVTYLLEKPILDATEPGRRHVIPSVAPKAPSRGTAVVLEGRYDRRPLPSPQIHH